MSNYLGFEPTQRPDYYFVSYNSEDCKRVGELASQLSHANMPLWYDYALEYGEKWESQISVKIKNCRAVVLFFTRGILEKENSYVRKEYEMATKYFDKKVFVIMMDKIQNKDVPCEKVPWWIDIQEHQIVDLTNIGFSDGVGTVLNAVGISLHEDKMSLLIKEYKNLYDKGETKEAEKFLTEYLHGQNLVGKAQLIANIICGDMPGSIIDSPAIQMTELNDEMLKAKLGKYPPFEMEDLFRLFVKNMTFTIVNREVSLPPSGAAINAVQILREYEQLYIATNFRDACNMRIFYDSFDDIIFIGIEGEDRADDGYSRTFIHIITVEKPCSEAICNTFYRVRIKK